MQLEQGKMSKKRGRTADAEEETINADGKHPRVEDLNGDGEDNELDDFFDEIDAEENKDGKKEIANNEVEVKEEREEGQEEQALKSDDTTDAATKIDGDDVSQAAYEARLAKLMLMSRRKKSGAEADEAIFNTNIADDDVSKVVGSGLSMGDIMDAGTISSIEKSKSTTSSNAIKDEGRNSPSYKDIMKKKRMNKRRPADQFGSDDDDGYWANF